MILDANDPNCSFRTHVECLNKCLGTNLMGHMQACYPQKGFISETLEYYVWFPKLYHNSSGWKNAITNNGKTIIEVAETNDCTEWVHNGKHPLHGYRLVFAKPSLKEDYRFVGVFKTGRLDYLHHSYERVATRVELIGSPVYKIRNLD